MGGAGSGVFGKAQPCVDGAGRASGRERKLGGALAKEGQELLGPAALVTLLVADDGELAGGRTAGEGDVNEAFLISGVAGDLGQNRNADPERNEGFHGGDLGAPEADAGLKVVIAAEALDLTGEGA
jgi:hypothetical protein